MRILRWLFRRQPDLDARIDKELRFHIEEIADRYVAAGVPRDEALRRARADFGGVPQIAEQVRDVWTLRWLDDAARDVQFAARTYVRMPIFALTAILTLALGIGVNTALFTVIRQVLLKTLPVSNPHELVEVDCRSGPDATGGGGACMHSYPAFQLLTARHDGLTGIFAFSPVPNGLVASYRGVRETITGQLASANMFDVLGVGPAAGRLLIGSDDRPGAEPVVVLSYGYWSRAFGADPDLIGRSLTLNGRSFTVAGVLPRTFRGVTLGQPHDVVLPLGQAEMFRAGPQSPSGARASILTSPHMGWLTFMGRRQHGVSDDVIGVRLAPVFKQSVDAWIAPIPADMRKQLNLTSDDIRVDVRPAALGTGSNLRRSLEPTLRVVAVVALLVLLIACANLTGLFLAQTLHRHREFGLRLALGAARFRLMRQIFTETLLLAIAGSVLGFLLATWMAPAGFSLATDDTALRAVDLAPDRWMLAFTAALAVATGLLVGAASVLRASRANPQEALRNASAARSPRLTKVLLTAQIALTVTLVGSAALFLETLTNLRRIDVGFQPNQLIAVTMDPGIGTLERSRAVEYVRQASAALAALPGVRAVTYSNRPFGGGIGTNFAVDVPDITGPGSGSSSGLVYAGPGFIRTLGMTLLSGRDFDASDRPGVAIVNESFAMHFFPTSDAVGRSFRLRGPGNQPIEIAGVVKDARDNGVKRAAEPLMYFPFGTRETSTVTFTVRADAPASSVMDTIRRTLDGLDPSVGIGRLRTVDAQFDDVLRRERLLATLGTLFGGLALLLLAVGLYGVLNGSVVRRTAEIGLRMALGAGRRRIAWLIARETLGVLAAGTLLGLAGYAAAAGLIRSQLFGIHPADVTAPIGATAALVMIATLAVWLPSRAATRIEPGDALRRDFS